MSRTVRCRRCGRELFAGRFDAAAWLGRLCPEYRGPLPPTALAPIVDELILLRLVLGGTE